MHDVFDRFNSKHIIDCKIILPAVDVLPPEWIMILKFIQSRGKLNEFKAKSDVKITKGGWENLCFCYNRHYFIINMITRNNNIIMIVRFFIIPFISKAYVNIKS